MNRSQIRALLEYLRAPLIAAAKTAIAFAVTYALAWLTRRGVVVPAGSSSALVGLLVSCVGGAVTFVFNLAAQRFPAAAARIFPAATYQRSPK